jgi:AmmeMemoRadiSam system protein A
MHRIVALARQSIEEYVRAGRRISPPSDLSPELSQRAGVFVCIKKHGNLRGCVGTFQPCSDTVAEEVIRNAIAAATQDSRFSALTPDELEEIEYSVDVLSAPEKVEDLDKLDPKLYGVIVSRGIRRGLLLPDLQGVDTVEEQLRIAKIKAAIGPDEEVDIYRFTVTRYG